MTSQCLIGIEWPENGFWATPCLGGMYYDFIVPGRTRAN